MRRGLFCAWGCFMLVRIYTGDDGQSHFEELALPVEDVLRVAAKPGEDVVFRRSAENGFSDWHHPSRRQYLIVLEGEMEVTCGDGSARRFVPGDVLLAEDLTGQGHQTRAIGGRYRSVSMGLPD